MSILACLPIPESGGDEGVEWRYSARCRTTAAVRDLFFSQDRFDQHLALRVCQQCPVQPQCLADELTYPVSEQHGVRGGLTAVARRDLLGHWRHLGVYRPSRSYRLALEGSSAPAGYPQGVAR